MKVITKATDNYEQSSTTTENNPLLFNITLIFLETRDFYRITEQIFNSWQLYIKKKFFVVHLESCFRFYCKLFWSHLAYFRLSEREDISLPRYVCAEF